VNFTNVSNAIKAIDGVKNKPEYANLRIAHGKDRCANPPRSGPQGASGARRSASGNGPNSAEPVSAIGGEDGEMMHDAFLNGEIEDDGGQEDVAETSAPGNGVVKVEAQDMHIDAASSIAAAAVPTAA
jgi:hypothetical protein